MRSSWRGRATRPAGGRPARRGGAPAGRSAAADGVSPAVTLPRMMPVAILCGGKGTRMREAGETLPKPLVEIGGRPILWHVMCLYATQGLSDFVLLLGHGAERIRAFAETCPWKVTCVDTGLETPTGGRVARARGHLGRGTFCLAYADGVADIDLSRLLDFHRAHGRAATVTVVRPQNPWGVAHIA